MRLLFDQNLSPRLVSLLADLYPDSAHVLDVGLGEADDRAVWTFAGENGFAIVSNFMTEARRTVRRAAGFPRYAPLPVPGPGP